MTKSEKYGICSFSLNVLINIKNFYIFTYYNTVILYF